MKRVLKNAKNELEVQETLTKLVKNNSLQTMLKFVELSNSFVRHRRRDEKVTKISTRRRLKNEINISSHNI